MKKFLFLFVALVLSVASASAEFQPAEGTKYLIKHVKTGLYLKLNTSIVGDLEQNNVNCLTIEDKGTQFTVAQSGNGFTIYSEEDGEYLIKQGKLEWNPGHGTDSFAWFVEDAGNDAYYLMKSAEKYCAPDGEKAGAYVYNDKTANFSYGTKWQFVDVSSLEADVEYTVVVEGLSGATVTYNGTSYKNGDKFTAKNVVSTQLTVTENADYIYAIRVDNGVITVTYTYIADRVTSAEEIDFGKYYTITTFARGALTVADANATYLAGTIQVTQEESADDVRQQFAFVKLDGKLYLYSLGTKKFVRRHINNQGVLSEMPEDEIAFADAGEGTVRLYVETTESNRNFYLGGSNQFLMEVWNTKDLGNSFIIKAAGDFDRTDVFSAGDLTGKINEAVNGTATLREVEDVRDMMLGK